MFIDNWIRDVQEMREKSELCNENCYWNICLKIWQFMLEKEREAVKMNIEGAQ